MSRVDGSGSLIGGPTPGRVGVRGHACYCYCIVMLRNQSESLGIIIKHSY